MNQGPDRNRNELRLPVSSRPASGALFALLLVLSLTQPRTSAAETVVLIPSQDNTLFETMDGDLSSGVGPSLFFGANSRSNVRRALLAFDLAGIVAGSTIDSVSLRIHVSQSPNGESQPMTVHRVLASWGEGSSSSQGGAGAPAEAGDATWIHRFYADSLWNSPGGDFLQLATASALIGSVGFYEMTDSTLATDVSSWLTHPEARFGWLLRGNEGVPSSARRMDSRESADSTLWPRLTVHFTEPVPTRTLTWGRIKSLFGASAN